MSATAPTQEIETARVSNVEGWTLWEYGEVDSTNRVAADLTVWEAVRANTQTAGRGRFQRTWVSDAGGLWLSAVIPVRRGSPEEPALPLVAGLVVAEALQSFGVRELRLRWPNDVLVGGRKLAGLLMEQFAPGRAVAGIGINVRNQPEAHDAQLASQTARLADILPNAPELPTFAAAILRGLRGAVGEIGAGGLPILLTRINQFWAGPRRVELDLDGNLRRGVFGGIESDGRLILLGEEGGATTFHPHQVRHLKELAEFE